MDSAIRGQGRKDPVDLLFGFGHEHNLDIVADRVSFLAHPPMEITGHQRHIFTNREIHMQDEILHSFRGRLHVFGSSTVRGLHPKVSTEDSAVKGHGFFAVAVEREVDANLHGS